MAIYICHSWFFLLSLRTEILLSRRTVENTFTPSWGEHPKPSRGRIVAEFNDRISGNWTLCRLTWKKRHIIWGLINRIKLKILKCSVHQQQTLYLSLNHPLSHLRTLKDPKSDLHIGWEQGTTKFLGRKNNNRNIVITHLSLGIGRFYGIVHG